MAENGKQRNSNFELLRIICIFMIIFFHSYRTVYSTSGISSLDLYVMKGLSSWGALGIDIFVIISAWFSVDLKFNSKKVKHILLEVISYFVIFAIAKILLYINNGCSFGKSFFRVLRYYYIHFFDPFWFNSYWFI